MSRNCFCKVASQFLLIIILYNLKLGYNFDECFRGVR